MAQLGNAIPIRWDGGAADRWFRDPASLALLEGSPIDCLVVSWPTGVTQHPLVTEAHRRNLSVVGWATSSASPEGAIAAAKSAGLDGIAIEGFQGKSDFPVIPIADRAAVAWDSPSPILGVTGNVWPGVSRQGFGAQ